MKANVTVSDLHVGSLMGLCPDKAREDGGGIRKPNKFQKTLLRYWRHFWDEWVPEVTRGAEDVSVTFNGDVMEGIHHNTVAVWTNDVETQESNTIEIPKPIVKRYPHSFLVRGTPAHGGQSCKSEERIARELGLAPNEVGDYSVWQLRLRIGDILFQFAHHIGVTSSAAYETSAPMRELVAGLVEAAQWGQTMPRVIVRSHRHRFVTVPIPSLQGRIECVITPGWQLRTPNVERIDRMRMPHIGGVVFLVEDHTCQVKEKLYPLPEPKAIRI